MLVCATVADGVAHAHGDRIAVVVGRVRTIKEMSKDALRDLYLRRQRVRTDGMRAIPVNLPADNPIRERFSATVLGRSPQDLVPYWNAPYFEGITPPPVISSPAAIVYLAESELDERCRSLLWLE